MERGLQLAYWLSTMHLEHSEPTQCLPAMSPSDKGTARQRTMFYVHPWALTQGRAFTLSMGLAQHLHAMHDGVHASSSVSAWLQRGLYHNLFDRIMSVDGKTQLKMLSPVYCVVSCWRARWLPAPAEHDTSCPSCHVPLVHCSSLRASPCSRRACQRGRLATLQAVHGFCAIH